MKKLPLLFVILFLTTSIRSQYADKNYYLIDSLNLSELDKQDAHKLDSLIKVYHSTKSDSVKLITLDRLTHLNDFNTWAKYNFILLAETKKRIGKNAAANNKFLNQRLANALYNSNYYYSMINNEDSAFKYLQLSIEPFRKCGDKSGLADAYNALGVYYNRTGNINESLKWYQKGLFICESINDKDCIARAYISIGVSYRDINEWSKALENCNRAIKIWEETGNKSSLPEGWNHIGIIYKWSGDTVKAKSAYEKSLQLAQAIKDDYAIATAKLNLGIIFQNKGEYDKAIKNYTESLEGFEKVKSTNGIAFVLNSLALTYNELGKYSDGLRYALKSYELAQQMGYPESLINSAQVLGETYEKLGKYKEAIAMQRYYFKTKDSLQGAEAQKTALKTQLEFENQKKLLDVKKEQDQKNLIAAQEKKQHFIIIGFVVLSLIIVGVFFVLLFNRFRIIKKQKVIIEEQNHLVIEKNREILDSIAYAKRLQEAILPSAREINKHLPENFVIYKPKDIVAGDFYWMHVNENDHTIFFAVADSTGHGVPGALVSVVCSNALNASVKEFGLTTPGQILDKTRELVLETFEKSDKDVKDGMDISLVSIKHSDNSYTVNWSGANNPFWYFSGQSFNEIKPDKQPVGKVDNPKPFTTHSIQLNKGDMLYLFTDGYADQFGGPKGKKFKYKALGDLLTANNSFSVREQESKLTSEFENWKGKLEQVDDVCLIGIKL
ncbi:MAG: tetratricopeptide repeat protein [Bacteroidia bacterium]